MKLDGGRVDTGLTHLTRMVLATPWVTQMVVETPMVVETLG